MITTDFVIIFASRSSCGVAIFIKSNQFRLGPFGKCVELIEKIIVAFKDRPSMYHRIEFLPILTEVLLRSDLRYEHTLELIQDVSFGISIKSHQSYLERLIKFCLDILSGELDEVSGGEKKYSVRILLLLHYVMLCYSMMSSYGRLPCQC